MPTLKREVFVAFRAERNFIIVPDEIGRVAKTISSFVRAASALSPQRQIEHFTGLVSPENAEFSPVYL